MKNRRDLIPGPKEKAIAAVKAGNQAEAISYIEELSEQFRPLHDRYGDWIQLLLGFISEKLGESAIKDALYRIFEEIYRDRYVAMNDMSPEDVLSGICRSSRAHYSEFDIEEDDDNFTVVTHYCGSGGRLEKEGKSKGRRTTQAYPWSFGHAGVSYYCCHEAIFNIMFEELGLNFLHFEYCNQFDDSGQATGCSCRWIVPKKK